MTNKIKIFSIVFSVMLCISTNSFSQIKIKGESNKIVMGQDRIDDPTEDQYNILSASVFGKEGFYRAGSKLAFGDFGRWDRWGWNAFIGEWGPTDTDQLWLHGKKGFVLTYGRAEEDYYIMWFDANNDRRLHIETEVLVQGVKIPANEEDQQDPDIITNPLDRLHHLDGITYKHKFFRIKSRGDNVAGSTEEISDKERADEEFFSGLNEELNNYAPQKNGFNANQLKEFFPELVETDKDGNNYIDYTGLIPVLVEGMKEQSRVIKAQSLKIKEMGLLAGDMTLMNDSTDSSFATKGKFDSDTASDILANAFLYQNAPNPFNTTTEIKYFLPEGSTNAYIYVFNMQGNLLLTHNLNDNGFGSVLINGSSLTAGMYIYSLVINGQEAETKRMILTK